MEYCVTCNHRITGRGGHSPPDHPSTHISTIVTGPRPDEFGNIKLSSMRYLMAQQQPLHFCTQHLIYFDEARAFASHVNNFHDEAFVSSLRSHYPSAEDSLSQPYTRGYHPPDAAFVSDGYCASHRTYLASPCVSTAHYFRRHTNTCPAPGPTPQNKPAAAPTYRADLQLDTASRHTTSEWVISQFASRPNRFPTPPTPLAQAGPRTPKLQNIYPTRIHTIYQLRIPGTPPTTLGDTLTTTLAPLAAAIYGIQPPTTLAEGVYSQEPAPVGPCILPANSRRRWYLLEVGALAYLPFYITYALLPQPTLIIVGPAAYNPTPTTTVHSFSEAHMLCADHITMTTYRPFAYLNPLNPGR
jgi:hypothetical protein